MFVDDENGPVSIASRCFFGFGYTNLNPIDALQNNEIPVCFIHGEADDFIPCSHSVQMHEATKGYSELHLFPGATHAMSFDSDEMRYKQIVRGFLDHIHKCEAVKGDFCEERKVEK